MNIISKPTKRWFFYFDWLMDQRFYQRKQARTEKHDRKPTGAKESPEGISSIQQSIQATDIVIYTL